MNKKIAVVSGGSSGIGREIAFQLNRKGYAVFELSRTGSDFENVRHIDCDVSCMSSVETAVSRIIDEENQIDLLINNAGMGISGAVEFTEKEDAKHIFDVNFFGTFYLLKAVVPHMRERRTGRILNISSVAADIAIPFQGFYSASKSAVSSLTSALRNEVMPFGIDVAAILPGDVTTGFTSARKKEHTGNNIYSGRIDRSVAQMEEDEQSGMSSEYAARKIVAIAHKRRLRPKYVIGSKYRLFVLLFKILPSGFSSLIVRLIYAK